MEMSTTKMKKTKSKVVIQKRKRESTSAEYYIDKKKLYSAMVDYKQSIYRASNLPPEQKPRIPAYIGECILLLCKKIASLRNFAGYPFREDMEGDGYENVCKYIDNFNEKKYNDPYAYFTQIIMFAYIRRIKAEKMHLYVKQKTLENTYTFGILEEGQMLGVDLSQQLAGDIDNEYMNNLVVEFEKQIAEKKRLQKAKKKKQLEYEEDNE
jgi:hypothetical protein